MNIVKKQLFSFLIVFMFIGYVGSVYAEDISAPVITGASSSGHSEITINYQTNNTNSAYNVQIYNITDRVSYKASITSSSYTILGLETGKNYSIKMRTYKGSSRSDWSNVINITPNYKAPTINSIKSESKKLTLNYSRNDSSNKIEIYNARTKKYVQTSNLSYTFTGLENGKAYKFKMRNYYDDGFVGEWSDYTAAVPEVNIPKITGKTISNNYITLKYDVGKAKAKRVQIYVYNVAKTKVVLRYKTANLKTYKITGLAKNTKYKVRIRNCYLDGNDTVCGTYTDYKIYTTTGSSSSSSSSKSTSSSSSSSSKSTSSSSSSSSKSTSSSSVSSKVKITSTVSKQKLTVKCTGGIGPYTISYDIGGRKGNVSAVKNFTFKLTNPTTYAVSCIDSKGSESKLKKGTISSPLKATATHKPNRLIVTCSGGISPYTISYDIGGRKGNVSAVKNFTFKVTKSTTYTFYCKDSKGNKSKSGKGKITVPVPVVNMYVKGKKIVIDCSNAQSLYLRTKMNNEKYSKYSYTAFPYEATVLNTTITYQAYCVDKNGVKSEVKKTTVGAKRKLVSVKKTKSISCRKLPKEKIKCNGEKHDKYRILKQDQNIQYKKQAVYYRCDKKRGDYYPSKSLVTSQYFKKKCNSRSSCYYVGFGGGMYVTKVCQNVDIVHYQCSYLEYSCK